MFETAPFFSFHHANAFEAPGGRVVLDTVAMHEGVDFSANFEVGLGGDCVRVVAAGARQQQQQQQQ